MPDNSSELDPQIVFGDLFSRLYEIRKGTFNHLGVFQPSYQLSPIMADCYKLRYTISLNYLDVSIKMVEEIQSGIEILLQSYSYESEPKDAYKYTFSNNYKEELEAKTKLKIESELGVYHRELTSLRTSIRELSSKLLPDDDKKRKIKLKLSVEQFGALIALLIDFDLLDEPNKSELSRLLVNSFSTKKGGPTVDSILHAINLSDNAGLNFWSKLLPAMQGKIPHLKK